MSFIQEPGAPVSRQIRNLIRNASATLAGRPRGRDREVRRNSYDVDDGRAQPWRPIGDGSAGQGIAHRESLLQTAEELRLQGWKDLPAREIRAARDRRDMLAAELDGFAAAGNAPIGRPATIRQEMGRLDALLARARDRLRRVDLDVLAGLLHWLDFKTGRLFPSMETIASAAGCHRNSVIGALRRLSANGLISWVRRSIATDNVGQFAPQREQTSNAYYFEHRQRMAPRVWQRYCQILAAKVRRLGARPASVPAEAPSEVAMPVPSDPGLRAALSRLGALIPNAST